MNREQKIPSDRFSDAPRDRPHREGSEHANLERPGAQVLHPKAVGWRRPVADHATAWRFD